MLRDKNYYSKVAVEFLPTKEGENSKIAYWTEAQIRALQVFVVKKAEVVGWRAVQQWLSTFIVYNGPTKRDSKPMHFLPNGKFVEEFKPGFINICSDFAVQLFEMDPDNSDFLELKNTLLL